MGKKGANKKKQIVVANVDLAAFTNEQKLREQQEAEFHQKDSIKGLEPMAKIKE